MADFPPNTYASRFEIGETYTFQIERRGESKKNGSHLMQLSFNPANKDGITQGTMWFSPPGDERHVPEEWAMLEAVAGVMDGDTFTGLKKGKPWYWQINGEDCKPAGGAQAPSQPSPTPQATQPPRTAPAPSDGAYRGPLLKDTHALFTDCAIAAAKAAEQVKKVEEIEVPETVWGGWASALFIQMCREGAAHSYTQRKPLHLTGDKPPAEGDLPF